MNINMQLPIGNICHKIDIYRKVTLEEGSSPILPPFGNLLGVKNPTRYACAAGKFCVVVPKFWVQ